MSADSVIPSSGQPGNSQGVQQDLPLAFVDGKPVTVIPQDLYIPPDALSVILQAFEGPLDLLLYLIRKQNMDILNIDVCEITRQYMEYIDAARTMKFELAAEYLLMAAMLAEIKSRMLLPKPKTEDGEEIDPRAELIRRLQIYEQYKKAAEDIDSLPKFDQNYFATRVEAQMAMQSESGPEVSLEELMLALKGVLERSDHFSSHHIQRETLSTRERMAAILSGLSDVAYRPFEDFFRVEEGRQGVVVTFLAIMELVKEQLLELIQVDTFGAIHVKARSAS
jgi:segregation and condensation protein A